MNVDRSTTHNGTSSERMLLAYTKKTGTVGSGALTPKTSDVREELMGELNSRVTRWLDKVLTVNYTVYV
eukprot:1191404-Prorocentrum_minimum.AAC.2